ncbi:MAG: adenosylcobinamide-GDP ribazoletransferase [Candidatus Methanomethylophilaceae archaeon]|nr:adenosylcobinamide-GDP ribazoletransferase [Candidatus Methanomethylophilaceae archaeon]
MTGSALRGMVSFFTLWHLDITQEDMDAMERGFHMVPAVGLIFGAVMVAALSILSWIQGAMHIGMGLISAVACLLIAYVGSKFIHFDGLTDFGDGMIVSGMREDHVRALKDTLVGAGGIGVAIAVTLTSFAIYATWGVPALVILAPLCEVAVKNSMVFAASFGMPGNGMAGRQVEKTTSESAFKSLIVSIVCGMLLLFLASLFFAGGEWLRVVTSGAAALAVGLMASSVVGVIMARNANRVFGMVNGDILGATNEICRPVAMFFMGLVYMLGI